MKVYSANGLNIIASFNTNTDIANAKRTIDFIDGKLLVSSGYNGVGVYNLASGALVQQLNVATSVVGVDQSDIMSNAVSVNQGRVFVANGGAGL